MALNRVLIEFDNIIRTFLTSSRYPRPTFVLNTSSCIFDNDKARFEEARSILDHLKDGIVYVQKRRQSIETRLRRKYGDSNWPAGQKLIQPKNNIISCLECGHFHEVMHVCRNCYSKVKDETDKILEKVRGAWRYDEPVDTDIQISYKGETPIQGKRIIEIEYERPAWFKPNILQPANIKHSFGPDNQLGDFVDTNIKEKQG